MPVDVGQHHAGSVLQQPLCRGRPDATRAPGHERHPPCQRLWPGHPLEFRLFQQPVFDIESLLFRQALIGGYRACPAHHVDRVDVELSRDARGRLVEREGDHPDAGHQIDHGVGVAECRAAGVLAAVVIGGVVDAVSLYRGGQGGQRCIQIGLARVKADQQRSDLCAQEMIGAGRAHRSECVEHRRADKLQHGRAVVEVSDLVPVLRDQPPDRRHQSRRDLAAFCRRQRGARRTAKRGLPHRLRIQPVCRLVDDLERGQIAVLGVIGPGEQSMAFQHRPAHLRVFRREFSQPQTQLVARPLPRKPADLGPEHVFGQRARVDRCCKCDDRVGMDVIDVLARHISVQRRVDAGRARVQVERAVRQEADHLILVRDAAIDAFQSVQFFHVER